LKIAIDLSKIYGSYLVAYSHPLFSQVVASSEYLQIVTIWYQLLYVFVNLFWFLALPSSITKYNIFGNSSLQLWRITFYPYQTCFLCMLQVIAVSFCNFIIDSLLYPRDWVYKFVAPLFNEFDCKGIFGIDSPNDDYSIFL